MVVRKPVKFPAMSLFYREPSKGEVIYHTWQYELNCLLRESAYKKKSMLLGIQLSLRVEAADTAMCLGETASVSDI